MLAHSLLSNHEKAEIDISNLPGGIQDAWMVLSETTKGPNSSNNTNNATISLSDGDSQKQVATLPMGQGQLGKAAAITALSACVKKTSEVCQIITEERQERDGAILKSALETSKRKLNSGSTTQAVASTTKLWMRIMDHRLKEIRSYHARNANQDMRGVGKNPNKRARLGNPGADGYDLASSILQSLGGIRDGSAFSSEEVMGKYLDLQPLYESHVIPIKSIMMKTESSSFGFTDFLAFLSKGETGLIEGIAESTKLKERKKYVRFLVALETYLEGFLGRIQPLLPKDRVTEASIKDFEETWSKTGGSPGWEAKPSEAFLVKSGASTESTTGTDTAGPTKMDLSPYASAADLEKAVDGDALKAELTRLGLKCGGTVADRAKRLFMTKDTPLSELPKKFFAKKKGAPNQNNAKKDESSAPKVSIKNERRVDIAKREVVVMAYLNQLKPILEATMRRTGRRETQTSKEREKEMEEDLHGSLIEDAKRKSGDGKAGEYNSDDESDDEDAPIYNPKGVPLGWDGKPIPYWLFKLHGLNHFYKCEICGGESYRGRKNFEQHFAEARHAYGMKSLGIPNTKHFHGVTKIEDAQALWAQLKEQLEKDQFDGTNGEEYEDSHGNVLSRATYEDLARQGLL